jgi:hypothetical protein
VAVRQASDKVEVLYVACTPKAVSAVQLVRPADQRQYILADSDPVNWAIHFANPTPLKRFVVGEVPDGATEDVRLANGLPPETYFAVRITLVDNSVKYACFRAKDLGDRVAFYGRYMPADEFARESKCD